MSWGYVRRNRWKRRVPLHPFPHVLLLCASLHCVFHCFNQQHSPALYLNPDLNLTNANANAKCDTEKHWGTLLPMGEKKS